MNIRIKEYFDKLAQSYMMERLTNNVKWDQDEDIITKFLPLILMRKKMKLLSATVHYTTDTKTAFKLTLKYNEGDYCGCKKTFIIALHKTTVMHEFYYTTMYQKKFNKNAEWYLDEKELQNAISIID